MLAVATPGLPGSYGLGGGGPRIGAGGGAGRLARGADAGGSIGGGARQTLVELGAGPDFPNVPKIVADNPGKHVIAVESPEMKRYIDDALQNPGIFPEFDQMAEGFRRADKLAEIRFLDYTTDALPASIADEVIIIAPQPGTSGLFGAMPQETANALSRVVKPGGRIRVIADNRQAAKIISKQLGTTFQTVRRANAPYKSKFLDDNPFGESYIIDFRVP